MQTFLPTYSMTGCAKVLDNKRLFKQALEAWQILMVLTELDPQGNHRTPKGWVNHPAVKMWKGSEAQLYAYAITMVNEAEDRGVKTTLKEKLKATLLKAALLNRVGNANPSFIGNEELHSSHRRALLAKDYEYYSANHWPEDPGYPPKHYEYYWPTKENDAK